MGGVAGHMSHLYDNPNLKFSQMMDIFKAASNGELEGTEKTDGQNLFVGYNIVEGKAKAARNKSNVRQGGLDAAGLAQKFAGRGTVEQAFNEAFETFELAAQSLSEEAQREIFGDGVSNIVFYNAEIQDPRNANVINYNTKLLNIHRVGHFAVDLETGEILDVDVGPSAAKLESSLEHIQWAIEKQEFKVQVNAIRRLEGLSDDRYLHYTLERLNRILDDAGISDNQTVGEYTIARLIPMIRNQVSLPEDKENLLIKRLLGVKGINIRDIKRDLDPTQVQAVRMLVSNTKAIVQSAIQPLEDIVHDFSVEMIRNLKSAFVLDQEAEVERLRAETDQAIKGIEASGNEEAMEILRKQMQKLKTIENVSTAAEGFVFDYDGYTYKFTGNFAPMNQLLGLFKYGRGNIPAMQLSEDGGEGLVHKKKVALIAGGFRPPHRGHLELVKDYVDRVQAGGDVVIFMSTSTNPKTMRYIGNDKTLGSAVTVEQSLEIWRLYLRNEGIENRVEFVLTSRGPIAEIIDLIKISDPEDVKYFLAAGEKDAERYNFMLNDPRQNPNGVEIDIVPTPTVIDSDGLQMSATRFRSILREPDNNLLTIEDYVPETSRKDIDQILSILEIVDTNLDIDIEKKTLTLESLFSLVDEIITEGFGEGKPPKGEMYKKQVITLEEDEDEEEKEQFRTTAKGTSKGTEPGSTVFIQSPIEEIAAMGHGSVAISPAKPKKVVKQPKRLVKRRK